MNSTIQSILLSVLALALFSSCSVSSDSEKVKPLVYEGMKTGELIEAIGLPSRKDTISTVYQVETESDIHVVHWIYSKRTVVVIGDRVKIPNLERP